VRLHARLLTYSRPVSSCALCPHRSVPPFLTQEGAAAPKTDTQGSGDKPGGRQEPLCPRVPDALVRGVGASASWPCSSSRCSTSGWQVLFFLFEFS